MKLQDILDRIYEILDTNDWGINELDMLLELRNDIEKEVDKK